jgi:hypothetical protein
MTQTADGQHEIVAENLETMPEARLARLFTPAVEAAEGRHRAALRFVARHTGADQIIVSAST